MGTVYLTNGHHGLLASDSGQGINRRVKLRPEWLDKPIVVNQKGSYAGKHTQGIVCAALQGLIDLKGFDAAVSFRIVQVDSIPHVMIPNREWGEIYMSNPRDIVVTFSHDSRFDNHPFRGVHQWLEDLYDGDMSDDAFDSFAEHWSQSERWTEFFMKQLSKAVHHMSDCSVDLHQKAKDMKVRAQIIQAKLV